MIDIVLLFGKTVGGGGGGAGGERWQGDRDTGIALAVASYCIPSILASDQAVGILHHESMMVVAVLGIPVICHLQFSQGQTCCVCRFVH